MLAMISNSELHLIEREREYNRERREIQMEQSYNLMDERGLLKNRVVVMNCQEDEDCFNVNPLTNQITPRA